MRLGRVFRLLFALLALASVVGTRAAQAHDFDKASLTLTEMAPGRFRVRFHSGSAALQSELRSPASFPQPCRLHDGYLDCGSAGLAGIIELPWLEGTLTHVLVEVDWRDGRRLLRVAGPSSPRVHVYDVPRAAGLLAAKPIAFDYAQLGFEHILTGLDHLLFVIALTLLVRRWRALLCTVTAFTVAHSLTLAATVLGVVNLPRPPVEAAIALSIVLVCAECARPRDSITRRLPWLVAFAFGLLHGFGFASGLLAIGLPEAHIPTALVSFNIGVELGQLATIAVVLGIRQLAGGRHPRLSGALIYAAGGVAGFFYVERLAALLAP